MSGVRRTPPESKNRTSSGSQFLPKSRVCGGFFKSCGLCGIAGRKCWLGRFSREGIQHGDLLIARMKIAAYNQHCSAPFFRASVVCATKSTRSKEPTPSPNQSAGTVLTRFRKCLAKIPNNVFAPSGFDDFFFPHQIVSCTHQFSPFGVVFEPPLWMP